MYLIRVLVLVGVFNSVLNRYMADDVFGVQMTVTMGNIFYFVCVFFSTYHLNSYTEHACSFDEAGDVAIAQPI